MGISKRQRLANMTYGDTEVFIPANGISYDSTTRAITSDLNKNFNDIKTEFTIRKAVLVFSDTVEALAVAVVTRS